MSPGVCYSARVFVIILFSFLSSCLIAQQKTLTIKKTVELKKTLSEISGMAIVGDKVFAINDSGNANSIYMLDAKSFEIIDIIKLEGSVNTDWESLALFDGVIYIGNFGNNFGQRSDLSVYSVKLSDLKNEDFQVGHTGFGYRSQHSLLQIPYFHPFDCEAMIADTSGLWLFSKDWENRLCRLYKLDITQQDSRISALDSINLGYLVTGAYLDRENASLYLCGYEDNNTYLSIFDCADGITFKGKHQKYLIDGLKNRQIESIFVKDNLIYLASEKTRYKQAVYILEFNNQ